MRTFKMPSVTMGPLNRPLRFLRRHLPPLNFITLHYLYFIVTCLALALIFWGSSTPFRSITFTDSLFMTVSGMTGAGLNTNNLSQLNTFQQVLLFVLILIGSPVFVSAIIVHIRWKAFVRRFVDIKEKEERRRGLHRVKTWASNAARGRSRTTLGVDEEAGAKDDFKTDDRAESNRAVDRTEGEKGGSQLNVDVAQDVDTSSATGGTSNKERETSSPVSPATTRTQGIQFADDTRFAPSRALSTSRMSHTSHTSHTSQTTQPARRRTNNLFSFTGVGARPGVNLRPETSFDLSSPPTPTSLSRAPTNADTNPHARRDISKYLDSPQGWIARNSQFYGLTEDEREALGGVEYRAVSLLAWLVPSYFVLFQLIASIGCGGYIALNKPEVAASFGVNPWWAGAFNVVSAFNNSGMSLIDSNMIPFDRSYYMLITIGILVLAGNTCFAIFLRIIVWAMYKIAERIARERLLGDPWHERKKTLRFLLDHPRRCYIYLFPSQHTWWLGLTVFSLNGFDWLMFELLNIGNRQIFNGLATRFIVIDSLFQTLAVRGGGFYVFTIPALRISLLTLYVVMMYISGYPVVITMRNSNVYEERSLGIYAEDEGEGREEAEQDAKSGESDTPSPGLLKRAKTAVGHNFSANPKGNEDNKHFVRQQVRAQLAHDVWWVVLGIFLIMIVEAPHFEEKPAVYSVFNYIFEIVSGYSCVGMSVGVPWASYSFSGAWYPLSKWIMCAIMLRGRHRGLPVAIDKAVLLPGEGQGHAEEEDGRIRLSRSRLLES